jgi:DNA-binding NarL/FixJ family response regulator
MLPDVASNRKMLLTLLEKKGLTVVGSAENGQEGVEMCKKLPERCDLLFIDNAMPVLVSWYSSRCLYIHILVSSLLLIADEKDDTQDTQHQSTGSEYCVCSSGAFRARVYSCPCMSVCA